MSTRSFCVCVPARNEAARLPVLLDALAAQTVDGIIPVMLCINNSDDDSIAVAHAVAHRHRGRLDVGISSRTFAPAVAHAGSARGHAMEQGHARLGGTGVLISTDADCRPPTTASGSANIITAGWANELNWLAKIIYSSNEASPNTKPTCPPLLASSLASPRSLAPELRMK